MSTLAVPVARKSQPSAQVILAWLITLAISTLPTILWNELGGGAPDWLFAAKLGLIVALLALSLPVRLLQPLRPFLAVVLILYIAEWCSGWLGATALWTGFFPSGSPFATSMLGTQLLRVGVAFVMVAALLAVKRSRARFFFIKGKLDAPAAPIPLIMTRPTTWRRLGPILSLCVGLGLLVFLVASAAPLLGRLPGALPLLPAVLVFAVMNSFAEEMNYRASFLSTLEGVIGGPQALLMTAAYFGLGHYYGVPYGVVGVVMAGVLGWLLGKSMLETRGFFWAWFIHFVQDVLIFSFMAVGSITPGG